MSTPNVQIPILSGIVDLTYLENAVTMLLADDPRLVNTPVIPEFKLQMTADQIVDILWTTPASAFTVTSQGITINSNPLPAGAPVGAGLLVEMPEFVANSPGVTGSPATWGINVVAFEERNTNLTPGTGTMITNEQYAQLAIDILQMTYIYGFGTLQVKTNAITPAHDWMTYKPGIIASRASFYATVGRQQSIRTAFAVPTIAGGMCTITCADGAAVIYYTIDGSMPVAYNSTTNSTPGTATLYTAPFAVTSGQTVLTAARNPNTGYILSSVLGALAP